MKGFYERNTYLYYSDSHGGDGWEYVDPGEVPEILDLNMSSQESENKTWYDLYSTYIFSPKSTTPVSFPVRGGGYIDFYEEFFPETMTPLQRKFTEDIFLGYYENSFFRENPEENFKYLTEGIIEGDQEVFGPWIRENQTLFPDYELLLKMYYCHDVKEVTGKWVYLSSVKLPIEASLIMI